MKKINQDKLRLLALVSDLEDKADVLLRDGKDTQADMLIQATGILRDCLESDTSMVTVVTEMGGMALLVVALSRLCDDINGDVWSSILQ